ncbi:MAG: hypothetical protein ACJAVF_004819, partial [Paraglaciecola sp.]
MIYYRVNEGSFKFEQRENRKIFELQKTQCALPTAHWEHSKKITYKTLDKNCFYP